MNILKKQVNFQYKKEINYITMQQYHKSTFLYCNHLCDRIALFINNNRKYPKDFFKNYSYRKSFLHLLWKLSILKLLFQDFMSCF